MTKCNCDICIGRGDVDGKSVCPYVGRNIRGGVVNRATLALVGEAGPEAIIPIPKEKKPNKDIIPIFIRKIDGTKPSDKEIMALYDRINEEYEPEQIKS